MARKTKPHVAATNYRYAHFEGQKFFLSVLPLDNCRYVRCEFVEVTFLYSGGPWILKDCKLLGPCNVEFRGAAWWTQRLMTVFEPNELPPIHGRRSRMPSWGNHPEAR